MLDGQVNGIPRSWKAFQANYDFVFSASDRQCSVCLTGQQIAALLSLTEYLKWPTRWVKDEGEVDKNVILNFTDSLERNLMNACCDSNIPIQWRYTSDGVLQQSLNGGETWYNAPLYDPRNNSPQFPPVTGDDGDTKKCIAATGAAILLKEQVGDQLTDDMSRYTLTELITDWVGTMIGTSNPFEALLRVVVNQIFALVIAVLRPALTEEVYDTFKCILYCRMANDASFDDSKWSSVRSDITEQIGGIAGVFLEHLVYLLGVGGLTNLVRSGGAATGDCSGCSECEDCVVMYDASAPGVPILPSETCDIVANSYGSGSFYGIYLSPDPTGLPVIGKVFKVQYIDIGGAFNTGYYDTAGVAHSGVAIPIGTDVTSIFMEKNVFFTMNAIIVP